MKTLVRYICFGALCAVIALNAQALYYTKHYNDLKAQTKAAQENYRILQRRLYINDFRKMKRSMKYMTIHKYKGGHG
jgi:hypothetical protein